MQTHSKEFLPRESTEVKFEKCLEAAVVQTRYIRVHRYTGTYCTLVPNLGKVVCNHNGSGRLCLIMRQATRGDCLSVCLSVTDETVRKTRIIIESFDEVDSDCKIDLPLF